MRRLQAFLLPVIMLIPIIVLLGCTNFKGIAVNKRQTVIMEPAVLTAGIVATMPTIANKAGHSIATAKLSNTQSRPVQIKYRFYWYDDQGLDVLPFEKPKEISIASESDAKIQSINNHIDAHRVRLYLFL